jgi:hypothetical protein
MKLPSRPATLFLLGALAGAAVVRLATPQPSGPAEPEFCADVPCPHFTMRTEAIESQIAQTPGPTWLAVGDSLFEYAVLPEICGRRPINAGVGRATTKTFLAYAPRLTTLARPDFIAVSLGTNDAFRSDVETFARNFHALVAMLDPRRVIVAPIPGGSRVARRDAFNDAILATEGVAKAALLAPIEMAPDGLHLTAGAVARRNASIAEAAVRFCR